MALRDGHSDDFSGRRGFRYGPSTSNTVSYGYHALNNGHLLLHLLADFMQRIECQWSKLRNSVTDWWIDLFKVNQSAFVFPYNYVPYYQSSITCRT